MQKIGLPMPELYVIPYGFSQRICGNGPNPQHASVASMDGILICLYG